jgi:ATP/maltotriose-dependent transcriptional regulator MalT
MDCNAGCGASPIPSKAGCVSVTGANTGVTPEVADLQWSRVAETHLMAEARHDYDTLGANASFGATVNYLTGRPDELEQALTDSCRAAQSTGPPYHRQVYGCLTPTRLPLPAAISKVRNVGRRKRSRRATRSPMRWPRARTASRRSFDGRETFAGRWLPRLLAIYVELRVDTLAPAPGLDGLTERELDVLRLPTHGLSNKEIAESLHLIPSSMSTLASAKVVIQRLSHRASTPSEERASSGVTTARHLRKSAPLLSPGGVDAPLNGSFATVCRRERPVATRRCKRPATLERRDSR